MQTEDVSAIYAQSQTDSGSISVCGRQPTGQQAGSSSSSETSNPNDVTSLDVDSSHSLSPSDVRRVEGQVDLASFFVGDAPSAGSSQAVIDTLLHKHLLASTSQQWAQSWASGASQPVVVPSDSQQQASRSYHATLTQFGFQAAATTTQPCIAAATTTQPCIAISSASKTCSKTDVGGCAAGDSFGAAHGKNSLSEETFCLDDTNDDASSDDDDFSAENSTATSAGAVSRELSVDFAVSTSTSASVDESLSSLHKQRNVKLWRSFSDDPTSDARPPLVQQASADVLTQTSLKPGGSGDATLFVGSTSSSVPLPGIAAFIDAKRVKAEQRNARNDASSSTCDVSQSGFDTSADDIASVFARTARVLSGCGPTAAAALESSFRSSPGTTNATAYGACDGLLPIETHAHHQSFDNNRRYRVCYEKNKSYSASATPQAIRDVTAGLRTPSGGETKVQKKHDIETILTPRCSAHPCFAGEDGKSRSSTLTTATTTDSGVLSLASLTSLASKMCHSQWLLSKNESVARSSPQFLPEAQPVAMDSGNSISLRAIVDKMTPRGQLCVQSRTGFSSSVMQNVGSAPFLRPRLLGHHPRQSPGNYPVIRTALLSSRSAGVQQVARYGTHAMVNSAMRPPCYPVTNYPQAWVTPQPRALSGHPHYPTDYVRPLCPQETRTQWSGYDDTVQLPNTMTNSAALVTSELDNLPDLVLPLQPNNDAASALQAQSCLYGDAAAAATAVTRAFGESGVTEQLSATAATHRAEFRPKPDIKTVCVASANVDNNAVNVSDCFPLYTMTSQQQVHCTPHMGMPVSNLHGSESADHGMALAIAQLTSAGAQLTSAKANRTLAEANPVSEKARPTSAEAKRTSAEAKRTSAEVKPKSAEAKPTRLLDPLAVHCMSQWLKLHMDHPYPSQDEKRALAKRGNITVAQVSSWFANKRSRLGTSFGKKASIMHCGASTGRHTSHGSAPSALATGSLMARGDGKVTKDSTPPYVLQQLAAGLGSGKENSASGSDSDHSAAAAAHLRFSDKQKKHKRGLSEISPNVDAAAAHNSAVAPGVRSNLFVGNDSFIKRQKLQ